MKNIRLFVALTACALFTISFLTPLSAQDAPDKKPPAKQEDQEKKGEEKPEAKKEKPKFKKYDEVITDKAVTRDGVFSTHMVEDKLYFEIPAAELGKEFIWVTQFSKVQSGNGWGGMPITNNVVRWERRNDTIMMRLVNHNLRAEPGTPVEVAVKASSLEAIIMSFPIVTFNEEKDKTPVIEVTGFFLGDIAEFSPKRSLNAQSLDKKRSFISSVKSFPGNIETRVMATFVRRPPAPGAPQRRGGFFGGSSNEPTATVEIHHSMVALPEKPMLPRLHDPRVGFFSRGFEDYTKGVAGIEPTVYISRWRLEKKDPGAAISEPVKPIVWYVGRGVPEKWRKYVAEGIEMWQPAFESAGFKNAIIAKEPPSAEEDPDWDAEDARYSTIRWLPTTVRNAFGPHIRDPRSGEILEADVRIFHDVLELGRNWYFSKCAAADPRAQKLPFSDELTGELLRYVVAHEVGHSIGLRHNHKSSYWYTVDELRDAEFTKKYGFQASIMDYSRFNYVAQPGDGAVLSWHDVGIYDHFAIEWGYRQFDGSTKAEDDVKALNEIANRQIENPRLIYASYEEGARGQADPFARSQDQTREPVKATEMGMKNLERIMGFIIPATTKDGEDFDMLAEIYGSVNTQMGYIMQNVAVLVGGIEYNKKVAGQASAEVFTPIAPAVQREAITYLLNNAFMTPKWLINDEISRRIGIAGVGQIVLRTQAGVLRTLFSNDRTERMIDLEATQDSSYTVAQMVKQLTDGIFSELSLASPKISVYRRNLQRAYVGSLANFVAGTRPANNDMRAIARATLLKLADKVKADGAKAGDEITRFHLIDLNHYILKALTGEIDLDD